MKKLIACVVALVAASSVAPRAEAGDCWGEVYSFNGSDFDVTICSSGHLEMKYRSPRQALRSRGVRKGTLWFEGKVDNNRPVGTGRVFSANCGPVLFQVSGSMRDQKEIRLTGEIPRVNNACRRTGETKWHTFVFHYVGEGDPNAGEIPSTQMTPVRPTAPVAPTCPAGFVLSGSRCVKQTAAAPTPTCPAGYVYIRGRCAIPPRQDPVPSTSSGSGTWAIIVSKSLGVRSALELDGIRICVDETTQAQSVINRYMRNNGMTYSAVPVHSAGAAVGSFENGQCDAFAVQSRRIAVTLRNLTPRNANKALPERLR